MSNLIFEELSISDEVVEVSDKIINKIIEDSANIHWENNNGLYSKNFAITSIKDFDIDIINVCLINFSSLEEVGNNISQLLSGFSHKSTFGINMLILNLPSINNTVYLPYSTGVIQHEVEHAFQIFKIGEYNFIKNLLDEVLIGNNLLLVSKLFKMTPNKFKKYLETQDKYLRIKFGKVIQNYFNNRQVNEIVDRPIGFFLK